MLAIFRPPSDNGNKAEIQESLSLDKQMCLPISPDRPPIYHTLQ